MKWTDYLSNDVSMRLANCVTIRSDLSELVNAKWKWMVEKGKDKDGFVKEDAVISVLELLDCNGIDLDLSKEEYNHLYK